MKLIEQQLFYVGVSEIDPKIDDFHIYVEANSIEEATAIARAYMEQSKYKRNFEISKVAKWGRAFKSSTKTVTVEV